MNESIAVLLKERTREIDHVVRGIREKVGDDPRGKDRVILKGHEDSTSTRST